MDNSMLLFVVLFFTSTSLLAWFGISENFVLANRLDLKTREVQIDFSDLAA